MALRPDELASPLPPPARRDASGDTASATDIARATAGLQATNAAHERRYADFLRTREAAGERLADRVGLAARVAGALGVTAAANGFTTTAALAGSASVAALGAEIAARHRAHRAGEDTERAHRDYERGARVPTLADRLGDAITATLARRRTPAPERTAATPVPAPGAPQILAEASLAPRPGSTRTPPDADRRDALAAALARAYVTVNLGDRTEFRFAAQPTRTAFTVEGRRLTTARPLPSVVRAMVDVAEARGWRELRASGAPEFARAVWVEAGARGLRVDGYRPGDVDRAAMRERARELAATPAIAPPDPAPARTKPPAGGTDPADARTPTAATARDGRPVRRDDLREPPVAAPRERDDPARTRTLAVLAAALKADGRLAGLTRGRILARAGEIWDRLADQGVTVQPRPVPPAHEPVRRPAAVTPVPGRRDHGITR